MPVESTNGTIYIDFSQLHAGVINEVAGGKVIASVYHNVVLADDSGGIFCGETIGVSIDLYGAVQGFETFLGLDGFGHTYFGFAIEYLALQVADAYHVIVHQSDGAYSGACQVKGDGRSQSAYTDYKDFGALDALLSFFSQFGENDLTVVSFHII